MYYNVGWVAFVGFALIISLGPIQFALSRLFSKWRAMTSKLTDARVKLVHEVIAGIRMIKMYAWEKAFGDQIAGVRKEEL
eukprot:gene12007-20276_t